VGHAETLHTNAQAHAHHRRLTNEMKGESPEVIKRELARVITGHRNLPTESGSGGSKAEYHSEVDHREHV
jgi:hypothetical protein